MHRTFLYATRIAIAAAVLVAPATLVAQEFGYFGDIGPDFWDEQSPDWETCGSGDKQSPVDIRSAKHHSKLRINYGTTTGEIFNNGHTVEVEVEGDNSLRLNGVDYELSQFHFHTASEHRVGGRGYDMELHMVHTAVDGSNAVIGVFMKRGSSSGALAPIFAALPDDVNAHHPLADPFNPADFLPSSQGHYRYVGSLTTPPCTEGVQWVVLKTPVTITDEDMAQFAERIHFNARLVQRTLRQKASHDDGGGHGHGGNHDDDD